MQSRRAALLVSVIGTLAVCAVAVGAGTPIQVTPEMIVWKDGPPTIPSGARSAILEGDPKGDGIFTLRIAFPASYAIPLHTHGKDERVTVVSGTVFVGIGDSVDRAKETRFSAGSFYVTPTPLRHWVRTGDEGAVLQVTGHGPWSVDYVNPADDPRKAAR